MGYITVQTEVNIDKKFKKVLTIKNNHNFIPKV